MTIVEIIFMVLILFGTYSITRLLHINESDLKRKGQSRFDILWTKARYVILGSFLIFAGIAKLLVLPMSDIVNAKTDTAIICFFGLYCAITFRYTGRESLEQRKKFNKFLGLKLEYTNFDVILN